MAGPPLAPEQDRSVPARLLSLNVGLPRDVLWQGRTVHTGIWKDPVEGPRMVTGLNVDGDGQGDLKGHGGVNRAVFVYQIESYRYWQEQLDRENFVYGQFGENFTVQGMPDDEVCIGDRYRIGEGIFEVSQPRVTCYRLGLRMDEPRMPSLVVAHQRPGFYLRTIQEGRVRAGDGIHKIAGGPEAMTVAEIDALLYLPHRTRASLIRALRIPALSEGWRGSFRELLGDAEATGGAAAAPPLAWSGLRPLRVESIERESATVVSIRLRAQEGDAAPPALPGQFLTVRVVPDPAAGPLMRTYSLSGPQNGREYRISVKREPHGAASGYVHTLLRAGDVLQAGAPRGSFVLVSGSRPVVLISAGVGATPLLAMLHALAAEPGARLAWWLHSARDRAEHAFRHEVAELLAVIPGAHRIVCYSRPGPDDRRGRDFDVAGHLDGAVMDGHNVPVDADFYICGPSGFMHDITAALAARGTAPTRVCSEIFGPSKASAPGVVPTAAARAPHPPSGDPGAGEVVSFARSNLSVPWDPSFGSLLEFAEACDVAVRWSCRTGVCHTCQTGLVSGCVDYAPEPLEPAEPGRALICCSTPSGELILDL
jgi:ferredoxin-NADP reductase/MOSC domain-containing protein YiiM/ferredoxin